MKWIIWLTMMMVGNVTSAAPHLPIEIVVHRGANALAPENTWSIPADGKTLCTQQLQQAIDAIYKKGGGRLTLKPGVYLTGSLMLRSGVELHLEEGATLLGSTNPYDYTPVDVGDTDDQRNDNASMALREW